MRLTVRGQRWPWMVTAVCLAAVALLLLFRGGHLPLMDGHPHRLSYPGFTTRHGAMTEADFEAAFGGPGRLVSGSRTAGTVGG